MSDRFEWRQSAAEVSGMAEQRDARTREIMAGNPEQEPRATTLNATDYATSTDTVEVSA